MLPVFNPLPQKEEGKLNHLEELLSALDPILQCTVKIDLSTEKAWLLQSAGTSERSVRPIDWKEYIDFYSEKLDPLESKKLKDFLSLSHLKELRQSDKLQVMYDFFAELPGNGLRIIVSFPADRSEESAYILAKESDVDPLLHHIIKLYVYNASDYFIYLDVRHNSYILFGGDSNSTSLPPTVCSDYTTELEKYAYEYVVPEDREMVIREMQPERVLSELEKNAIHTFTCGLIENGQYRRKRVEYRYYNKENQMLLLTRTDITDVYNEQKRQNKKLSDALKRALTDPLTGLLNYQGIREEVGQFLEVFPQMAALMFLDLDDFKAVNDTYGHAKGDRALLSVAEVLKKSIRTTDCAARIGGDEFVIFLENIKSVDEAAACAQRICDRVSQICLGPDGSNLSCSIGVAIAPQDGMNYEELVKKADKRVYRSKRDGKNQVTI